MCPIEEPIVVNPPEELDIETPIVGSVNGTRETADPDVRNSGSESIVNPILVKEVKYLINQAILGILPKLGFRIQKVDALPAFGENGVIYLVPAEGATSPNVYEEYYWVADDNSFELIGTTEVDLSNYGQLSGNNIWSGNNTFSGKFSPNTSGYGLTLPDTTSFTADKEIGLAEGNLNVIKASDIVNNTLTQAQFDLITNGKPTLIKGQYGTRYNIWLEVGQDYDNNYNCKISFNNQFGGHYETAIRIPTASPHTLSMNNSGVYMNYSGENMSIPSLSQINGKTIPSYPSSTGTFILKCVDGTLTWVQE